MSIFDADFEAFASDLEQVTEPDALMLRHRKAARHRGGVLTVVDGYLNRKHGTGRWMWSAGSRESGRLPGFETVLVAHAVLRSVAGYGPVPRVGAGFAREDRVVAQAIASTVPDAYRHCEATCILTADLAARYADQAPGLAWSDPRPKNAQAPLAPCPPAAHHCPYRPSSASRPPAPSIIRPRGASSVWRSPLPRPSPTLSGHGDAIMFSPTVWCLLVTVCTPGNGCVNAVVEGFVNKDLCQLAARGSIADALRHVAPPGEGHQVTARCVAVEMREA